MFAVETIAKIGYRLVRCADPAEAKTASPARGAAGKPGVATVASGRARYPRPSRASTVAAWSSAACCRRRRQAGVADILTGSVRRSPAMIRVTAPVMAQLQRAVTDIQDRVACLEGRSPLVGAA